MEFNSTLVALEPGMYILRHSQRNAPPLSVTRAPGNARAAGRIELLGTPNTGGSILRDGSDCIVMLVLEGPVELLVTACLKSAADAVPSLRIDKISLDDPIRTAAPPASAVSAPAVSAPAVPAPTVPGTVAAAAQAPAKRAIHIAASGVSLIAHIERTGDLVGHDGSIVGDPGTTLRLEGFQLMWPDRPAGVDIAYTISVEGLGALPGAQTGKFCGTRGQARRITEVTFALVGPQAGEYLLEGSAFFTGGFQVPVTSGVPASGPSGLEHLAALSVRTVRNSPATKPAMNPWDESAMTKVFKTSKSTAAKKTAARPTKAQQA